MAVKRLAIKKTRALFLKKGGSVKCLSGSIWLTADNQDIILNPGDEHKAQKRLQKAVAVALTCESKIEIEEKDLFFKQFSLFDHKLRFSGSLAG